MTREEAIFCEKSYIGETNCTDCKYYGMDTCISRESHKMAIKALEQEPFMNKPCVSNEVCEHDKMQVLDKIRAEIEENINYNKKMNYQGIVAGLLLTLNIINKYGKETE